VEKKEDGLGAQGLGIAGKSGISDSGIGKRKNRRLFRKAMKEICVTRLKRIV